MPDNTVDRGPKQPPEETESQRAQGGAYPSEVDNRRAPDHDGAPPRPQTEPRSTEGQATPDPSTNSDDPSVTHEERTDPFTGEPIRDPGEGWKSDGG
jgi:hypothetical protein